MKRILTCALGGLFLAGCVSPRDDMYSTTSGVTDVNDQPQTSVAGAGSLMPGAYGSREMPTGQFTGQERSHNVVGQRPTLPQEADARLLDHSEEIGTSAGTLGQVGVDPIRSTDLGIELSPAPSPSAADIYRAGELGPAPGPVGSAPGATSGSAESGSNLETNNPVLPQP